MTFDEYLKFASVIIALLALFRPELSALLRKLTNKIDFYSPKNIEIGFFDFGPTIGISGTLRNRGSDQFINNIEVEITRQRDNATYKFTWGFFRQISAIVRGERAEDNITVEGANAFLMKKDTSKIVNIQFHDTDTKERYFYDLLDLKNHYENYSIEKVNENEVPSIDDFKQNSENEDLIIKSKNSIDNNFYWDEGTYLLKFRISTDNPKKVYNYKYKFSLENEHVEQIKINRGGLLFSAMDGFFQPKFAIIKLE